LDSKAVIDEKSSIEAKFQDFTKYILFKSAQTHIFSRKQSGNSIHFVILRNTKIKPLNYERKSKNSA
jgi:hypothetical protein